MRPGLRSCTLPQRSESGLPIPRIQRPRQGNVWSSRNMPRWTPKFAGIGQRWADRAVRHLARHRRGHRSPKGTFQSTFRSIARGGSQRCSGSCQGRARIDPRDQRLQPIYHRIGVVGADRARIHPASNCGNMSGSSWADNRDLLVLRLLLADPPCL